MWDITTHHKCMRNYKKSTWFRGQGEAKCHTLELKQVGEPVVERLPITDIAHLKKMVRKLFVNKKMQIPKPLPKKSSYQPKQSTWGMCSEEHNRHLILTKESYDLLNYAAIHLASSISQYYDLWWLMQEKYWLRRVCWHSSSIVWGEK